jgi:hypothetical protein
LDLNLGAGAGAVTFYGGPTTIAKLIDNENGTYYIDPSSMMPSIELLNHTNHYSGCLGAGLKFNILQEKKIIPALSVGLGIQMATAELKYHKPNMSPEGGMQYYSSDIPIKAHGIGARPLVSKTFYIKRLILLPYTGVAIMYGGADLDIEELENAEDFDTRVDTERTVWVHNRDNASTSFTSMGYFLGTRFRMPSWDRGAIALETNINLHNNTNYIGLAFIYNTLTKFK